ncbi:MAG: hypothetical protein PHD74_04435 [Candidatus Krumholzibacteria bacterium]|nr:hypothetical protein [Candidatus Krumholzibacteria bacterium]
MVYFHRFRARSIGFFDEWSTAGMNTRKAITVLSILLLSSIHGGLMAQTLGQFGGAGAAPDGEGSVFMLAGNDAFRTGLSMRFNISKVSDFGIQLGVDRACEETSYGGGIDLKVVVLESRPELPINLALDASVGNLTSDAVGRFILGLGILASGCIETHSKGVIEPYLSFIVGIEQIDEKSNNAAAECLCSTNDDATESETIFRAGVKVPLSNEAQLLIEAGRGDRTLVGAALNIVF